MIGSNDHDGDRRRWALAFGAGGALAAVALVGCSGGQEDAPTSSATVSICVDDDPTRTGTAQVEVRQDGDVVGGVGLNPAGTAHVPVTPGPYEAYIDGELVSSGEVEADSITEVPCAASPAPSPTVTD